MKNPKEMRIMTRRKSLASINAKIDEIEKKISATKKRYEKLYQDYQQLQHEREQVMSREILKAMKKSGKSYREIMTFLQAS